MASNIYLNDNLEVLVVSAGGVGTSFLMKQIGLFKKTNDIDNKDGYKHMSIPPIPKNNRVKVIYVFGDPMLACVSLFRRNYACTQSVVIQKYNKKKKLIDHDENLSEYLEKGIDKLMFEKHFINWHRTFKVYPTLFIRYDAIHDNISEIKQFLGLPEEFLKTFPPEKVRSSRIEDLENYELERLNELYGKFRNEILNLNGCFKNEINEPQKIKLEVLYSPYRRGLIEYHFRNSPFVRKLLLKI